MEKLVANYMKTWKRFSVPEIQYRFQINYELARWSVGLLEGLRLVVREDNGLDYRRVTQEERKNMDGKDEVYEKPENEDKSEYPFASSPAPRFLVACLETYEEMKILPKKYTLDWSEADEKEDDEEEDDDFDDGFDFGLSEREEKENDDSSDRSERFFEKKYDVEKLIEDEFASECKYRKAGIFEVRKIPETVVPDEEVPLWKSGKKHVGILNTFMRPQTNQDGFLALCNESRTWRKIGKLVNSCSSSSVKKLIESFDDETYAKYCGAADREQEKTNLRKKKGLGYELLHVIGFEVSFVQEEICAKLAPVCGVANNDPWLIEFVEDGYQKIYVENNAIEELRNVFLFHCGKQRSLSLLRKADEVIATFVEGFEKTRQNAARLLDYFLCYSQTKKLFEIVGEMQNWLPENGRRKLRYHANRAFGEEYVRSILGAEENP